MLDGADLNDHLLRMVKTNLELLAGCKHSEICMATGSSGSLLHPLGLELVPPYKEQDWSFAGYRSGQTPIAPTRIFDATQYGATPDGLEDSSVGIQAAISAAAAEGGGTVFLPAGTYYVGLPINITSSNVVLKGAGKLKTTLWIPKPLSEAPPKPYIDNYNHFSRFCWRDGFLRIWGNFTDRRPTEETLLATIVQPATRGLRSIQVDSAQNIKEGEWVRLYLSDPNDEAYKGSLVAAMYGGYMASPACTAQGMTKCFTGLDGHQNLFHWASRIQSISTDTNSVELERPLPIELRTEWKPQLHSLPPAVYIQDNGIEDLRIEFNWSTTLPHHLDRGFNGVDIDAAFNAWVRNVDIVNADHGVLVRTSFSVTVAGITTSVTQPRGKTRSSNNGHIGIGVVECSDVLVDTFDIQAPMMHDTTVMRTTMSVWHNGKGKDLNLDAHGHAPYATLYTDMFVGAGKRVFTTGGARKDGFPIGAFTTYHNLRNINNTPILIRNFTNSMGKCSYGGNYVSYVGNFSSEWKDCSTMFVERKKVENPLFAH